MQLRDLADGYCATCMNGQPRTEGKTRKAETLTFIAQGEATKLWIVYKALGADGLGSLDQCDYLLTCGVPAQHLER